jgi:membrane-associated protein
MTDFFQDFAAEYAAYGYPVLFIGVLLENMGIPVPGETAVLIAGFLASPAGGSHFNIVWVILLTTLAAVIGDNLGYWLGRDLARPRLQSGRRFLFLTPKTLQLAEGYFQRYGLWTVFFARYITGLRVVAALAAGTAGMPWWEFLLANAAGAVAWATTMGLLGYFFGQSLHLLHTYISRGGLILLGCIVVLVGLPYLLRRLRKMQFRPLEGLTRAQIVQGLLVAVLETIFIAVLFLLSGRDHETQYDQTIREWFEGSESTIASVLAALGTVAASLPVTVGLTALLIARLWHLGRPRREIVVATWALLASELVGLTLVGLLHLHRIRPEYVQFWPYGYAGLVPLRAVAVFGTLGQLIRRQNASLGRTLQAVAVVLIVLAGFGVLWVGGQSLTETMLEYAAGAVVLFAGLWWLEGYGPGLVEAPVRSEAVPAAAHHGESTAAPE